VRIATEINRDYNGSSPVFVAVLNGSFMFAADLLKLIKLPCSISFTKLSSYQGTESTEKVQTLIGINEDITAKKIIILEDIIDTGITLNSFMNSLKKHQPAEIKIATLLFKPDAFKKDFKIDYIGMHIPNDFIVGYGLDYNGFGRNLPDIYKLSE